MAYENSIVLMDSSEIIDVVRRSLSKIDPRLVDHGERVGFIASRIYGASKKKSALDRSRLVVLCLLHDIGAYKTDEIDDMVRFETATPFEHSLFGYIFLKNTTFLADFAEAILYHHTDYLELKDKHCPYADYASIIHLADRADILINSPKPALSHLRELAGSKFDPVYVDAFFEAESQSPFCGLVASGEYKNEMEEIIHSLAITRDEIMDYLKLLVFAIDFRSPYTVTHTADTTLVSQYTAQLMGVGKREKQLIYIGAFLHDIGKIAIPVAILEKNGKLTDEEYASIKKHVSEGEDILRGVVSDEICDIALRHHEKLDGSGYLHGLKGDELTLPQRIVAVSDIFSALSQKRSYKEPFPKEKILSILTDMKSTGKLCPLTVDTITDNFELIVKKTEASRNPVRVIYDGLLSEYRAMAEKMGLSAKNPNFMI